MLNINGRKSNKIYSFHKIFFGDSARKAQIIRFFLYFRHLKVTFKVQFCHIQAPNVRNLHKYCTFTKEILTFLPVFAQKLVNLHEIAHVCVHDAQ